MYNHLLNKPVKITYGYQAGETGTVADVVYQSGRTFGRWVAIITLDDPPASQMLGLNKNCQAVVDVSYVDSHRRI